MNEVEEQAHLAAAQAGDTRRFDDLVDPYRHELLVHCYRILGSLQDAEDMLQETLLRAWRRLDTFENIAFRAWLYKIATNVCLDLVKKQRRRTFPTYDYPAADPQMPPGPPLIEELWLEPFPDHRLPLTEPNPEARYIAKEDVSLAFVAALQRIPGRQRAVVLLRDVLGFRANETAQTLDLTVSAVNSLLHRARVNLSKHYVPIEAMSIPEDEPLLQTLLDRYKQAWEKADVSALIALLKEEITYAMPPLASWYQGRDAVQLLLVNVVFRQVTSGQFQFRALRVNGQPGFAGYQQDNVDSVFKATGIQVVSIDKQAQQVSGIIAFLEPRLFPLFDLPLTL